MKTLVAFIVAALATLSACKRRGGPIEAEWIGIPDGARTCAWDRRSVGGLLGICITAGVAYTCVYDNEANTVACAPSRRSTPERP